jgi:hypothetical protein
MQFLFVEFLHPSLTFTVLFPNTVNPRKSNGLILEKLESRTKIREQFGLKLE